MARYQADWFRWNLSKLLVQQTTLLLRAAASNSSVYVRATKRMQFYVFLDPALPIQARGRTKKNATFRLRDQSSSAD